MDCHDGQYLPHLCELYQYCTNVAGAGTGKEHMDRQSLVRSLTPFISGSVCQVRDDGVWEEHRRTSAQRSEFAQSSKNHQRGGGAATPSQTSSRRGYFGLATGSPFTLEGTALCGSILLFDSSVICCTIHQLPVLLFQLTSELASIILEPRPPPPVEWAQTTELPNPGLRMPTAARRDATEASGSSRREVDGQSSKEGQPRPQGGESRGDKGGKPRVRRPQQLWKSPRKLAEWRRQQLTQRQEQGFIPEDGID